MMPHSTFLENVYAFLSAGSGAALALLVGATHRQLCTLISFAAGTLLGASLFHILPEAVGSAPWPIALLVMASGYVLLDQVSRHVFHVCPACSASHFEEHLHDNLRSMALLLGIGFAVHSTLDGIAIAIGRDLGHSTDHSIFLSVAIHKFPEGLALCAILLKSGFSRFKAFFLTLVMEFSTVLGWFLGAYLLSGKVSPVWIDLTMLHVSGGFIYLAFHAVSNEIRKHSPRTVIAFFLAGIGLMFATMFWH